MQHDMRFWDLSCRRCGLETYAALWRECREPSKIEWHRPQAPVQRQDGAGPACQHCGSGEGCYHAPSCPTQWPAPLAEVGFGLMEVVAKPARSAGHQMDELEFCVKCHAPAMAIVEHRLACTPATRPASEGETIARAVRWHR